MTLQRQLIFWSAAFLLLVAAFFLLQDVLLPFVAGLALAYLLDPVADRLQKWGMSRLVATIVILGLFILFLIIALVVAVPLLASQLAAFSEKLPDYVVRLQALAVTQGGAILERLGGRVGLPDLQKSIGDLVSQGATWLGTFLKGLWSGGQAIISLFSLVVVTPVVAFYLLEDWDKLVSTVDSWVPVHHRDTVRRLARDIDRAISAFVRGQALVCLFLGLWYGVGLSLVGLNFGLLIGLISGALSFIPYVGSLTGLVLSVGVALVQFWPDYISIGLVLLVFGTGQFIEGNILAPKVVGNAVGLHPVWLMFALFAFGSLFGFVGLLLAVPLAAAIGVLARHAIGVYLESPFYTAATEAPPEPAALIPVIAQPENGRLVVEVAKQAPAPAKPAPKPAPVKASTKKAGPKARSSASQSSQASLSKAKTGDG